MPKAMLEPATFLSRKSIYGYQAEVQAWKNLLIDALVTFDMLTEQGNFIHPIHQAQINNQAYYQYVSDLALKALQVWTLREPSAFFHNLIQQSWELFTDFLACVNEAVEQKVDKGPTREMLIKQLVWEVLNAPTRRAIRVVHK